MQLGCLALLAGGGTKAASRAAALAACLASRLACAVACFLHTHITSVLCLHRRIVSSRKAKRQPLVLVAEYPASCAVQLDPHAAQAGR